MVGKNISLLNNFNSINNICFLNHLLGYNKYIEIPLSTLFLVLLEISLSFIINASELSSY